MSGFPPKMKKGKYLPGVHGPYGPQRVVDPS